MQNSQTGSQKVLSLVKIGGNSTCIALDKWGYRVNILIISAQNICCGYSLVRHF